MGTLYTAIPGLTVPPINTIAWKRDLFLPLLAFRRAECPILRTTNLYFSQSGNDSTGDGSQGNPYKTQVKAQALQDALPSNGDTGFFFLDGQQWRETRTRTYTIVSGGATTTVFLTIQADGTYPQDIPMASITLTGGTPQSAVPTAYDVSVGKITFAAVNGTTHTGISFTAPMQIQLTKNNTTWGRWGNGASPPQFTAWAAPYNANSFTKTAGQVNTWQIAETGQMSGFREENAVNYPYLNMTSIADVEKTPASWFLDTAAQILYIHMRDDYNPKTSGTLAGSGRILQACYNNSLNGGIFVNQVDGTRIDGLWIDGAGFGTQPSANFNNPGSGLKTALSGSQVCYISNTQVSWTTDHAFCLVGGAAGGIVTCDNCKAYWGDFVCYSPQGGNEFIMFQCEVIGGGQFPLTTQPLNSGSLASTFISHSSNIAVSPVTVWSGNSVLLAAPAWLPAAALQPGMTITLSGGTPETKTISTFDPVTGTVVFTTNMNGTTHTIIQQWNYSASLGIHYGCVSRNAKWKAGFGWYGGQNGVVFASPNLDQCRNWAVNCIDYGRTPWEGDDNLTVYPITLATTGAVSLTLSSLPAVGYQIQAGVGYIEVGGGPEVPERVLVTAYNTGTGVISINAATPLTGTARTWIRYPATLSTGYNMNYAPAIGGGNTVGEVNAYGLFSTVVVNSWFNFQGGVNPVGGGYAGLGFGRWVGTVFFNDVFVNDYTFAGATGASGTNQVFLANGGNSKVTALFDHCSIFFRLLSRMVGVVSGQAGVSGGTASPLVLQNSIVAAYGGQTVSSSAVVLNSYTSGGIGLAPGVSNDGVNQVNNAYGNATFTTGFAGYLSDPTYSTINNPILPDHRPTPGGPLISTAANTPKIWGLWTVEYDMDWNPRSTTTPSKGPWEPITTSSSGGDGLQAASLKTWKAQSGTVPGGVCDGIRVSQVGSVDITGADGNTNTIPVTPNEDLWAKITNVTRYSANVPVTLLYLTSTP